MTYNNMIMLPSAQAAVHGHRHVGYFHQFEPDPKLLEHGMVICCCMYQRYPMQYNSHNIMSAARAHGVCALQSSSC